MDNHCITFLICVASAILKVHAVEWYYVYEVHIWVLLLGLDIAIDLCRCFVMVTGLQWEHFPMTAMQTTGHRDLVNCLRYGSRSISSLVQEMFQI